MEEYLFLAEPSDYDVWAIALLLYPTKGMGDKCPEMMKVLGKEGIKIFRETFVKTSSKLIALFFTNHLIISIWPILCEEAEMLNYFSSSSEPNPELVLNYRKITYIM
jgi:hypothetical protein